MDGFKVMEMAKAAEIGDVFITVTGCKDVIRGAHIKKMKDGAILCNAGHFNVEINIPEIAEAAVEICEQRNNIMGYKMADGRWINLLADGRLVNLAAGDGHPAEIMDMSFSIQALSAVHMINNHDKFGNHVVDVPKEIDTKVALMKLKAWGVTIDKLSDDQEKYLKSWQL